jgi:hypothetical protein
MSSLSPGHAEMPKKYIPTPSEVKPHDAAAAVRCDRTLTDQAASAETFKQRADCRAAPTLDLRDHGNMISFKRMRHRDPSRARQFLPASVLKPNRMSAGNDCRAFQRVSHCDPTL